jgi:hypothetical protein
MKQAVETGSHVTIYVPTFIKIGSGIKKLMGVGNSPESRRFIAVFTKALYWSLS